jgi:aldehyde dehydrogenase (NAD+)
MRLRISKTPKFYSAGKFQRSESGRVRPFHAADGSFLASVPVCSRKDLRNAVEAAAMSGAAWAKRTPYNRGQILYRLAEMMEARAAEFSATICLTEKAKPTKPAAAREVTATIDRIVHYAGWADKYQQVLGSVNPVASPHFNFTVAEPLGVVGVVAPDAAPLLGLLSLVLPAITGGNAVVSMASQTNPWPALLLGEVLATSDLPGGVVNVLTGNRRELLPVFASHEHLGAVAGVVTRAERAVVQTGAAESVKRLKLLAAEEMPDWFATGAQGVYEIRDLVEWKTVWHPVGA